MDRRKRFIQLETMRSFRDRPASRLANDHRLLVIDLRLSGCLPAEAIISEIR